MTRQPRTIPVTDLHWLKMQLRLAALEQSGARLGYRFEFHDESLSAVTCHIYYVDDDSNPMSQASQKERSEIYDGRIALAMDIVCQGLALADLPATFSWTPTMRFVLYESQGMGGAVVHRAETTFHWPEPSREGP